MAIVLFSILFWNMENYFDCTDQGVSASDAEFSATGKRHWTRRRFDAKTAMIGKTFLWCGELPPLIGLAEVENARVLKNLVHSDVLRKCGYSFIHYDSPDPRGIDVALLYRAAEFEEISSYAIAVDGIRTRDILYACMQRRCDGGIWHIFVNHHPSKYGGGASESRRLAAMRTLKRSVDSLVAAGAGNIVAMGDFNDTPDALPFSIMEGTLVNMGLETVARACGDKGPAGGMAAETGGSIRFRGEWQLIDNFLVSEDVAARMGMTVLKPPFLLERDRQYPGDKPRRTYTGPRYNGGVSDHLPVMLADREDGIPGKER